MATHTYQGPPSIRYLAAKEANAMIDRDFMKQWARRVRQNIDERSMEADTHVSGATLSIRSGQQGTLPPDERVGSKDDKGRV